MTEKRVLNGRIVSGTRKAAFFTQIPWVKEQCLGKMGFEPYPGTLNIELDPENIFLSESLHLLPSSELVPPDPSACGAKIIPVTVEGIKAAVVLPDESVRVHGRNILEVIAPVSLKESLNKHDGDTVSILLSDGVAKRL